MENLTRALDEADLASSNAPSPTNAGKFCNPFFTAKGEERGYVDLVKLETLWINTGTLCNITCTNCYIESSPRNDRLVYISHQEVTAFFDEIEQEGLGTREIGLTGGEPFMNPDILKIMEEALARGFKLIVLTNAMRPMMRFKSALLELRARFNEQMTMRVSVDHYSQSLHEEERGSKSWQPMLEGLKWLSEHGFNLDIAGRTRWNEKEEELRQGYDHFFKQHAIKIDANNHKQLVLFPEMEPENTVPEISSKCWDILKVSQNDMMCATSRMVIKRKGAEKPAVIACTLLPYEKEFEFAASLKESSKRVQLNHPFCSKFCVLGGGACSIKA